MQLPKNKTRCDAMLKEILRQTGAGKDVDPELAIGLKKILQQTTYRDLVGARGATLGAAKIKYAGGFQQKSLVVRIPGSKPIPLSKKRILEQIYGKPKRREDTVPTEVLAAFRAAIRPQIIQFKEVSKDINPDAVCPYLGVALSSVPTAVDHVIPFSELLQEFAKSRGFDLHKVKTRGRGTKKVLADRELANDWFRFHLAHSDLELISQRANSMKGAGTLERKFG